MVQSGVLVPDFITSTPDLVPARCSRLETSQRTQDSAASQYFCTTAGTRFKGALDLWVSVKSRSCSLVHVQKQIQTNEILLKLNEPGLKRRAVSGRDWMYRQASSACPYTTITYCVGMLIQTLKRRGPNTLPCGTPLDRGRGSERRSSTLTDWDLAKFKKRLLLILKKNLPAEVTDSLC